MLPEIKEEDGELNTNEDEESPRVEPTSRPLTYAPEDRLMERQGKLMVDIEAQIMREEEEKVRHNPVFNGIDIREDKFFKFDEMRANEIKKALRTDVVKKNKELTAALEKELYGYGKKDMSKYELEMERQMMDQMHNLDFMMENGELMQEDEVVKKIILKEVTKTKSEVIDDHRKLDGNLVLKCDTVNGYMQAVFQLLSHNKTFVRYFMRNAY
jgi:hypothetical protein